jgi:hypothetical protein
MQRNLIALNEMKRWSFLLIILLTGAVSCLKDKQLPDVPQLTTSSFEFTETGGAMILGFTDGDGNFGLEEGDTSGVFSDCIRSWNLYAEYYELRNGIWTREVIDPCDGPFPDNDVAFYYAIPWAKPTGQDQTQEGEIRIDMNTWYLESEFDTIRFEVKIVDRAMNESNTIVVGPLIKQ